MMRSIVVFPDPEAPRSTKASPAATSKLTSSSTRVFLKLLLRPRTLAAISTADDSTRRSSFAPAFASRVSAASPFDCFGVISFRASLAFEPVAREEEREEDDEREERQDDCDGVRRLDLPLVEFREDVERRGLRAARQIPRHENRRAEIGRAHA